MFFKLQDITVDPDQIVAIERKQSFAYVYLRDGIKLQSNVPDDMELEDITALWEQSKLDSLGLVKEMPIKTTKKKVTAKKKEDPEE